MKKKTIKQLFINDDLEDKWQKRGKKVVKKKKSKKKK